MQVETDVAAAWKILSELPAVSYTTAAALLGVSDRQIRRLVANGKLESCGLGHAKKVASWSIREYGGFRNSDISGQKRANSDISGPHISGRDNGTDSR